ncbi:hypothetical protein [Flavobacterium sp. GP15]|uniref:hypothetical protein n=1 Tax=Flavobacterium sp. GP15 TaxID=2758567 RepID=UPI00165DD787|nr:hypothetical protein [Flavobacterium sp. GP15]
MTTNESNKQRFFLRQNDKFGALKVFFNYTVLTLEIAKPKTLSLSNLTIDNDNIKSITHNPQPIYGISDNKNLSGLAP